MEKVGSRNNYFFILIKFILFLIIFCFLVEISQEFFKEMRTEEKLEINIFFLSVLSCFVFYTFVADLNNFYKKIQKFFFHSSFFSFLMPSLLLLSGISFFIFPKVFNLTFNRDTFLFLGGFIFASHLIFIARETKGSSFTAFIDYLFFFSLLYVVNLFLFGLYLKVIFEIHLGGAILKGIDGGVYLIRNILTQIFK